MVELVSISVYTLLVSYMGVGNLRVWAEKRLLAIPNERSSHTRPTPSGGGIAIAFTSLLGILLFAWLQHQLPPFLWGYWLGALLIAIVSWFDDLHTVSSRVRFLIHSFSALLILSTNGAETYTLPLIGELALGWVGYQLTFLWLVGLTNAYNFMDGIDGIAGSQAVIAGLAWAVIGYTIGQPLITALGLFLALSSLGFLHYNWPPACIFMGDVGSAFLGYSIAVLAVIANGYDTRLMSVGILIVWPFLFDTLFTVLRRLRLGENIFQAHRSHLYQRMVIAGRSHGTVTTLYASLALVGALLGLGWLNAIPGMGIAIGIIIPLLALALWTFVIYCETRFFQVKSVTR